MNTDFHDWLHDHRALLIAAAVMLAVFGFALGWLYSALQNIQP